MHGALLSLAPMVYRHSLDLRITCEKVRKGEGKPGKRGRVREGEGGPSEERKNLGRRERAREGEGGLAWELRRGKAFEGERERAWEGGLVT